MVAYETNGEALNGHPRPRTSTAARDDLPGAPELVLELALGVLDPVVLHGGRIGGRLRQALDLRRRHGDRHGPRGYLSNLRSVHEVKPARAKPDIDDETVEDVALLVPEDVLDRADRLPVGADHLGAALEREVGGGLVGC